MARWMWAAGIGLASLGCASAGSPGGSDATRAVVSPQRVEVRNASQMDVTVLAVRGGAVVRLGLVTAKTDAEFRLPEILGGSAADLRFLVDPIGSTEAYLSDPVWGSSPTVVLHIAPVLDQSTVSAW